jgi:hypothetical protein
MCVWRFYKNGRKGKVQDRALKGAQCYAEGCVIGSASYKPAAVYEFSSALTLDDGYS